MPSTPDEELVRRLLADARHDEPMPADVAARLDRVLGELGAEAHRPAGRRPEEAVRLRGGSAPRRRRWAAGLATAAAVAAVAAVAPHVSFTSNDGASSDASSASDSGASSSGKAADRGAVAELHQDSLAADVRRTVRWLRTPGATLAAPGVAPESFGCAAADWGAGTTTPAHLDGRPVMLVVRPPANGRQVAEVLECGTARVLDSVTLRAP